MAVVPMTFDLVAKPNQCLTAIWNDTSLTETPPLGYFMSEIYMLSNAFQNHTSGAVRWQAMLSDIGPNKRKLFA